MARSRSSSTQCLALIAVGALCSFIFNWYILGDVATSALLETRVIAHIVRFCSTAFCLNLKWQLHLLEVCSYLLFSWFCCFFFLNLAGWRSLFHDSLVRLREFLRCSSQPVSCSTLVLFFGRSSSWLQSFGTSSTFPWGGKAQADTSLTYPSCSVFCRLGFFFVTLRLNSVDKHMDLDSGLWPKPVTNLAGVLVSIIPFSFSGGQAFLHCCNLMSGIPWFI